jgi:hypothetical protein
MPGPGEPDPVASGMRGGYNSDLDGEGGEPRMRPAGRSAQRQPHPDAGRTPEEGHDIPQIPPRKPRSDPGNHLHGDTGRYPGNEYVPPPNFRPEYKDYRHGPSGHYFYPPPPPMPMPTSAPAVPGGWFHLTKRQKLREDESRSSKALILPCPNVTSNTRCSASYPIQTAGTRYQGHDDFKRRHEKGT